MRTNSKGKQVCVVVGATSKWQSDGRNTVLAHGHPIDDSDVPVGIRWGVGGAVAQKFAQEGFFTVLTTRNEANAAPLAAAVREHGVHVANIVIDGSIDSPGSRALPRNQNRPDLVLNPIKIAEAYYYLHTQDKSCWTHELQLTPYGSKPSY